MVRELEHSISALSFKNIFLVHQIVRSIQKKMRDPPLIYWPPLSQVSDKDAGARAASLNA